MKISNDIIPYSGKHKTLLYNYYANKLCIINNKLWNSLQAASKHSIKGIALSPSDRERLIESGVIIINEQDYLAKDFRSIYEKKIRSLQYSIQSVYLHITQRCNLNCSYCYNKTNLNLPSKELTLDQLSDIATKFQKLNIRKLILTGGEALLRNDIIEICKLFKERGLFIEVLSNGTLLAERSELFKYIDHIIISLDTLHQQKNERIGLNISQVLSTLSALAPQERKKCSIRSVISRYDLEGWREVKAFCDSHNLNFILNSFIPNSLMDLPLIPPADLEDLYQNGSSDAIGGKRCGASLNTLAINSNGDIYPCQTFINPDMKLGNILLDNIPLLFKSTSVHSLFQNRNVLTVKDCSCCKYKFLCGGGCPVIPYKLYQDLNSAPKPMCAILKHGIDIQLKRILEKYDQKHY